jgi:hypothetical protein
MDGNPADRQWEPCSLWSSCWPWPIRRYPRPLRPAWVKERNDAASSGD